MDCSPQAIEASENHTHIGMWGTGARPGARSREVPGCGASGSAESVPLGGPLRSHHRTGGTDEGEEAERDAATDAPPRDALHVTLDERAHRSHDERDRAQQGRDPGRPMVGAPSGLILEQQRQPVHELQPVVRAGCVATCAREGPIPHASAWRVGPGGIDRLDDRARASARLDARPGTRLPADVGPHGGHEHAQSHHGSGRLAVQQSPRTKDDLLGIPRLGALRHDGQMSIVTTDSPLRDTDSPPRISVATVFVIGGALIGYTALSLGVLVAVFLLSSDPLSSARTIVAVFMSLHAAGCLTLVIWLSRRRGIPIRALGVRRPGWKLLHALWEFPLILIVATMAQILFSVLILGQSEPPDNGASRDIAGVGPLVFMVGLLGTAALTPYGKSCSFGACFRVRLLSAGHL